MWKHILEKYRVEYFLFTEYWGGDRPPRFSFLNPIARGDYFTLYQIDRDGAGFRNVRDEHGGMMDFYYLKYFWVGRFSFQNNPTTIYSIRMLSGSRTLTFVFYLSLVAGTLIALRNRRSVRWIAVIFASFTAFALRMMSFSPIVGTLMLTPPAISTLQLERLLGSYVAENEESYSPLALVDVPEIVAADIAKTSIDTVHISESALPNGIPAVFYSISEPTVSLMSQSDMANSLRRVSAENRIFAEIEHKLRAYGYEPHRISGGVVGLQVSPSSSADADQTETAVETAK
jgi:hypothetical protein